MLILALFVLFLLILFESLFLSYLFNFFTYCFSYLIKEIEALSDSIMVDESDFDDSDLIQRVYVTPLRYLLFLVIIIIFKNRYIIILVILFDKIILF